MRGAVTGFGAGSGLLIEGIVGGRGGRIEDRGGARRDTAANRERTRKKFRGVVTLTPAGSNS